MSKPTGNLPGRPSEVRGKSKKPLTLSTTDNLKDELKDLAIRTSRSRSDFVEQLVWKHGRQFAEELLGSV